MCTALYSFQTTLQFMKYFAVYAKYCGLQHAAQLTRYFKLYKVLSHPQFCGFPKISLPRKSGGYESYFLLVERETKAQKSQCLTLWSLGDKNRMGISSL